MAFGNGLTQSAAFNNTLQPCRVNVNSSGAALGACADAIPSGNVQDFNYGFNSGSSDNGDIASWTATGQQAFSRSFTYDALNRLATLNQSSGSATGCSSTFNLSWTYDAWGNRTDQNLVSGSCGQFHATVNTKNQLVDPLNNKYQYDAAGNMTNDGNHVYFYDAENRLVQVGGTFGTCSTATACYSYDAIGRRIEKATGSTYRDYLYDLAGNVVTEYCAPCSGFTGWNVGYVYLGGQMLAQYSNATTYFAHPDHLGSTRLLTALNQSVVQNLDYLPFGEVNSSNSGYGTHEFTGDERDSDSGNDYAMARFYINRFGRFSCVDPLLGRPGDPQSWNRYVYVRNNPTNNVDPSGMGFLDFLVNFFKMLLSIFTGGKFGWSVPVPGTPPIFSDPLGNTQATLNSIYHPGGLSKFGINNFALSVYGPQQSPCDKFSQSLVDRLYNVNKERGFIGAPAELGEQMVQQALRNVDEYGNKYKKGKTSVAGFKAELVSNGQDADVYRHILFTAGESLQPGGEITNYFFTQYDEWQTSWHDSHAKEAETEVRDDYAGMAVGNAMVKTSLAGKSGDYADLARQIMGILCI